MDYGIKINALRDMFKQRDELTDQLRVLEQAILRGAQDLVSSNKKPDADSMQFIDEREKIGLRSEKQKAIPADDPFPKHYVVDEGGPMVDEKDDVPLSKARKRAFGLRRTKEEKERGLPAGSLPRTTHARSAKEQENLDSHIEKPGAMHIPPKRKWGKTGGRPDAHIDIDKDNGVEVQSEPGGEDSEGAITSMLQEMRDNGKTRQAQDLFDSGLNSIEVAKALGVRLKTINDMVLRKEVTTYRDPSLFDSN